MKYRVFKQASKGPEVWAYGGDDFRPKALEFAAAPLGAYYFDTRTSKPSKTEGGNPLGYMSSVRKIRGLVNCRLGVLQDTYFFTSNMTYLDLLV